MSTLIGNKLTDQECVVAYFTVLGIGITIYGLRKFNSIIVENTA